MHKILVYGTLKRNESNHHLFDTPPGEYRFLGEARTVARWPLVVGTDYSIPFLLDCKDRDGAHHVQGEMYEVDDDKLGLLDELEQHPHWYTRQHIDVIRTTDDKYKPLDNHNVTESVWAYLIMQPTQTVLDQVYLERFVDHSEHPYVKQKDRKEDGKTADELMVEVKQCK